VDRLFTSGTNSFIDTNFEENRLVTEPFRTLFKMGQI
jgi:hypothetical protein